MIASFHSGIMRLIGTRALDEPDGEFVGPVLRESSGIDPPGRQARSDPCSFPTAGIVPSVHHSGAVSREIRLAVGESAICGSPRDCDRMPNPWQPSDSDKQADPTPPHAGTPTAQGSSDIGRTLDHCHGFGGICSRGSESVPRSPIDVRQTDRLLIAGCWVRASRKSWLFAGVVQVPHTKARRHEEEERRVEKSGFRLGPFVLLIRDLYVRCANFRRAMLSGNPRTGATSVPQGGKTRQPRVATLWSRTLGFRPPCAPALKGRHPLRVQLCSGVSPFQGCLLSWNVDPGLATRASRPWAIE